VDVKINWGLAWYPSSEQEVFSYREGAFFGSIFNKVKSPQAPGEDAQLLVGSQYACYSEVWNIDLAYLTDRLCVNDDSSCFEHAPVPCRERCGPRSWETQAYLDCFWNSPVFREWQQSITVHLNHPCDLAQDIKKCMDSLP
jgi:hypothetical protein